jgi:hypothetical protein
MVERVLEVVVDGMDFLGLQAIGDEKRNLEARMTRSDVHSFVCDVQEQFWIRKSWRIAGWQGTGIACILLADAVQNTTFFFLDYFLAFVTENILEYTM